MPAIETHGLTKRYGGTTAVEQLTVAVDAAEIYGFLGPNGAGKSTTIAMLVDHVRPTAGRARILGHDTRTDPLAVRRQTGLVAQDAALDGRLRARSHLRFALDVHAVADDPRTHLDRVGLGDAAGRRIGSFSTGMRQRLLIALALVGEPTVLLLDEPAGGLDPSGQRWLRELLRAERERGAAVFVSSHRLEQIEAVADRVGILVNGRLRAEGPPDGLDVGPPETVVARLPAWRSSWGRTVRDIEGVASVEHGMATDGDHTLTIALSDPAARPRVLDVLPDGSCVDGRSDDRGVPDLERAYTRLIGGGTCDG